MAAVGTLVGYTRCSTGSQDRTAQWQRLHELGVDRGLTDMNRARPGLDQVLAAVRHGDTRVVSKLDARSVPGARAIKAMETVA